MFDSFWNGWMLFNTSQSSKWENIKQVIETNTLFMIREANYYYKRELLLEALLNLEDFVPKLSIQLKVNDQMCCEHWFPSEHWVEDVGWVTAWNLRCCWLPAAMYMYVKSVVTESCFPGKLVRGRDVWPGDSSLSTAIKTAGKLVK